MQPLITQSDRGRGNNRTTRDPKFMGNTVGTPEDDQIGKFLRSNCLSTDMSLLLGGKHQNRREKSGPQNPVLFSQLTFLGAEMISESVL